MKYLLIIIACMLATGCGIMDPEPTYEPVNYSYVQTEGDTEGDTCWWTFTEDGYLLGAYKEKVENDTGFLPVEHLRGEYTIHGDTMVAWRLCSRVRLESNDPMDYQTVLQPVYSEFRIKYWEKDSIFLEARERTTYAQDFEGAQWGGPSLLESIHSAYK